MSKDPGAALAREFLGETNALYERIVKNGELRPLTLSDVESLDLSPLTKAQEALDQAGVAFLETLDLADLLVLTHRFEIIVRALAPYGREDGPLAAHLAALSGQGPQGAYRKASAESAALFARRKLGQA
ncbi:MAG: hypothetical protein M1537_04685 [Nitrospirae bacterium]|nr:MAG: hypothetical protein D084_Lepto4C00238G0002 [Leptospirillum sp. Group IV 'UBA BS']MCL4485622.1 hypothetical protein [Nitrospirota bacterium]